MNPYTGLAVRVAPWMVGAKVAVQKGATLFVSPAMWELVRHADGDELQRLLSAISVFVMEPLPQLPLAPTLFRTSLNPVAR